ncbi:MAG: integrase core domain-containing protein, partial [Treponemataceae bacterium]
LPRHEGVSIATIGRIIKKYNMFYRADIKTRRNRSKAVGKALERKRKPYNLRATKPNEIIEFDMKHIPLPGCKLYALCGIDQYTRRAVVHITTTCSSVSGKNALNKITQRFGKQIIIVNDNGSENMDKAEQWLSCESITQYWCRPHKPKDKPFIERFIGTLQTECLDYNYEPMSAAEMQMIVDQWLEKYENRRPHEGLGFLTPRQFTDKFYAAKHSNSVLNVMSTDIHLA